MPDFDPTRPLQNTDLTDDERAEQDRRIDAIGAGRPWREVLAVFRPPDVNVLLDTRLAAADADPAVGVPWDVVRARLWAGRSPGGGRASDVLLYSYVGPRPIADRVAPAGVPVRSPADVLAWARDSGQRWERGTLTATYTVDDAGTLVLADRHAEHVACAGGRPVRAAGEVTFELAAGGVAVGRVSNQSTGYCPGVECWPAVVAALAGAGLATPEGFDPACVFRRCPGCLTVNIVKGGVFECAACGAELPGREDARESGGGLGSSQPRP